MVMVNARDVVVCTGVRRAIVENLMAKFAWHPAWLGRRLEQRQSWRELMRDNGLRWLQRVFWYTLMIRFVVSITIRRSVARKFVLCVVCCVDACRWCWLYLIGIVITVGVVAPGLIMGGPVVGADIAVAADFTAP